MTDKGDVLSRYLFLVLLLMSTGACFAGKFDGKAYYVDKEGQGLHGYDLVAYFKEGKAVQGNTKFSLQHEGVTWNFSSAEHQDLFKANPSKYLPAYGGYCAWGMMKGYKAKVEPTAWKIVEGKLYLNYNSSIQKKWEKSIPEFIVEADKNWVKVSKQ